MRPPPPPPPGRWALTSRPPWPLLLSTAALLLPLAVSGACSSGDAASGGSATCVPGKVESCPCPAGAPDGVQTCADDGESFGTCECGEVSATDAGTDAGASDVVNADDDVAEGAPPDAGSDTETGPSGGPDTAVTVDPDASGPPPTGTCDPCGHGDLLGKVCAPSEQVFVANALVEITAVDCDGATRTWTTTSGPDGTYEVEDLPCGQHTVHVSAGSFETSYDVIINTDSTTNTTGAAYKLCFAADQVKIAVLWGQWDEQHLLIEELGFDYTFFYFEDAWYDDATPETDIPALQLLRDPAQLAAYDLIFFNCGSAAIKWVKGYPEIKKNLADFVVAGGSFYASDLSWAYVEAAFPDAIDFYGTDDLGTFGDGPQEVEGNQEAAATIEDEALAAYVGQSTFTAWYGPGPLIAVDEAGEGTTVHVKGVVQVENPSTDIFAPDTIPHFGPMVLSHRPSETSGAVIYTTFHNDEQADGLMKSILYYLVFLL